jgi:hypothetical protein
LNLNFSISDDVPLFSDNPSEETVPLRHLNSYSVKDDISRTVHFLSHLILPLTATAALSVVWPSSFRSPEDLRGQLVNLFLSYGLSEQEGQIRRIKVMHLRVHPGDSFEIELFESCSTAHPTTDPRRDSSVFLRFGADLIVAILEHLDLQGLEELQVLFTDGMEESDVIGTSVETWRSFFRRHPSIHRLNVGGSYLCDVISALEPADLPLWTRLLS